jgi:hypothetical protein
MKLVTIITYKLGFEKQRMSPMDWKYVLIHLFHARGDWSKPYIALCTWHTLCFELALIKPKGYYYFLLILVQMSLGSQSNILLITMNNKMSHVHGNHITIHLKMVQLWGFAKEVLVWAYIIINTNWKTICEVIDGVHNLWP